MALSANILGLIVLCDGTYFLEIGNIELQLQVVYLIQKEAIFSTLKPLLMFRKVFNLNQPIK